MKINQPKSVAILGPGAVGGFLAAIIVDSGLEVECIARPARVKEIKENGISLVSKKVGDKKVYPQASEKLTINPDVLFITTKAPNLSEALTSIDPTLLKSTVVIPLLNGFEHVEKIRKQLGNKVAVGSIMIEVFSGENKIVHSSNFVKIRIASKDINKEELENIVKWLTPLGVDLEIGMSEEEVLWNKLVRLNVIALVTSVTNKPIGEIRDDKNWREKIKAMINEGVNVAQKYGVNIEPSEVMKKIDQREPQQLSSMQRDISSGRKSEIEDITGAIIRAGEKHKISCPTISEMYNQIKLNIK